MFCVIKLDIKRIVRNKPLWIIMVSSVFLFFSVMGSLSKESVSRSSIPIGIFDSDQSVSSKQFIRRLKLVNSFTLYQKDSMELNRMLDDGGIMAYFEILPGFQKKLQEGKTKGLLKITYGADNKAAIALADIVSGEFMYELCQGRTVSFYKQWKEKQGTEKELRQEMDSLLGNDSFSFGFDLEVISGKDGKGQKNLKNELIYHQVIFGLLAMMASFLVLFLVECLMNEKESPLLSRISITPLGKRKQETGHILAMLFVLILFLLLTDLFFFFAFPKLDSQRRLQCLFIIGILILVYLIVFYGLKKILKSSVSYQLFGGMGVLFMGGMGLFGIFIKNFLFLSKFIPNYWFIQSITDILLL